MRFKKAIVTGTAAALCFGSVLNVSAANTAPLKDNKNAELIINVEAYKAAYSDLAAAFGDNTDAYVNHYLTAGVYEGRTKGVLFNPLAYAEAYPDIKAVYGDDISAIVAHYTTYGVKENRTLGTAGGYADIAEAEKYGAVPRFTASVLPQYRSGETFAAPITGSYSQASAAASYSQAPAAGNSGSQAPTYANPSAEAAGNRYAHTTSIYSEDGTLLRVEYYDDNKKLCEYSVVTNYDSSTNSYTEEIYSQDMTPVRTDTYVDGSLSSSEKH